MEIQIFGSLKSNYTQKAIRFFKERKIKVHFVDLNEKSISKGELENISKSLKVDDLIDTDSKEYARLNLKYILHDITNVLLEYPLLFKTPITRHKGKSTVGYQAETWKIWIRDDSNV